ncbi:pleckstrin homology domain-containing family G member 7 isoform X1 [Nerophis lumbriciformis]|uniref:pleckstrin homology domain-containing family G member 7 isoform X1 n=1 Tax=Nerophis lumbriciformis TaxID=546530 RepID=UPI002ADFC3EB|nr:pleckstrin homology domain-containing family G member 7-like isoform X1 [Nerophis lumbriciformis]XP_061825907.1 pleckstrin homology domain-containing family G member 7-like isoform X1 [Nerophis lumbriciformis]XP_061825908.1 pleckstrin homology domain-containing family G member 7-like isoform X1 [Nerophis lumbriciformis]
MSTIKHVVLKNNEQDAERKMDWGYIEWVENEVVPSGVVNAETQTDGGGPSEHKECQTSNPVIMHIELTRTHSKLRHSPLLDNDGMVAPFFQFDRQAPGRISTSPTLRRIRSTRRPVLDCWDPAGMGSTLEDPSKPISSSPLHRVKSPLAMSPLHSDGAICHEHPPISSCGRERTRSHRSKTFDNGTASIKPECHSAHPTIMKEFGFPDGELQEREHRPNSLQERRRSSVVVSLPGLDVSPGDLFVSNGAADMLNNSNFSDTKKSKWPFSRRSTTKGKSQNGTVSDIEKYLTTAQIQDWRNCDLHKYKDYSLAEFLQDQSSQWSCTSDSMASKRQEAIWELFTSECVYFLDQLMVLKEVFLATLSNLQMRKCLADIDSWGLFANLSELCLVSFGFLSDLLRAMKNPLNITGSGGSTLVQLLSNAFQESICHCLQKYCLNYSTALIYLDSLKPREDFGSYVKWCERHEQCRRLQLRDLLVAPLQRLTRYPLLLRNIARRFETEEKGRDDVQAVAEQVDMSICDLEGKVKWLDNYQKVKQLRDALVWLPVWERDKRAIIPENLKHLLKDVTLENLISHRSLLHDGKLVRAENSKLIDVYLFLFDEFLLITKLKRNKKRSIGPEQNPLRLPQNLELDQLLKEGCTFTVLDQPVSLDRLQLRNIDQLNASTSGLPHSFIIMHRNRYQQCIGAFILQASSEASKRVWISKIEDAVSTLLKLDSQQLRANSAPLWLESSQI